MKKKKKKNKKSSTAMTTTTATTHYDYYTHTAVHILASLAPMESTYSCSMLDAQHIMTSNCLLTE